MPDKKMELGVGANTAPAKRGLADLLKYTGDVAKGISQAFKSIKLGDMDLGFVSKLAKEWQKLDAALGKNGTSFKGLMSALATSGRTLDAERRKLADLRKELEQTERAFKDADVAFSRMKKFGLSTPDDSERSGAEARFNAAKGSVATQEGVVTSLERMGAGGLLKMAGGAAAFGAIATLAFKGVNALPGLLDARSQYTTQTQARYGAVEGAMRLRPGQGDFSEAIARSALLANPDTAKDLADVTDTNAWRYTWRRSMSALNPFSKVPWTDAFDSFGSTSAQGQAFQRALAAEATKNLTDASAAANPEKILAGQIGVGSNPLLLSFMRSMGSNEGGTNNFLHQTRLETLGKFSPEEMLNMASGIGRAGGGRAGGFDLASGALNVVISGMDQTVAQQIAGGMAAGGAGGAMLNHLRSIAGSRMDVFAAQRAGAFTADNYLTGFGLNSGEGLMKAMTYGFTNGPADAYFQRLRESAMGGLGAALGGDGADPYQKTIGLMHAMRITRGSNADLFGVDRLASLKPQDLFQALNPNAPISGYDAAMGLTKGMQVEQGRAQLDSLMIRNIAKGDSPMARLAQRIDQGDISLSGAILGEGGTKSLGGGGTNVTDSLAALVFNLMKGMGVKSPDEAKQLILGARGAVQGKLDNAPVTDKADKSAARDVNREMLDQEFRLFMDAQGNLRDAIKVLAKDIMQAHAQATSHLPPSKPARPRAGPSFSDQMHRQ